MHTILNTHDIYSRLKNDKYYNYKCNDKNITSPFYLKSSNDKT
jgi:hypothetical protein